MTLLHHWASMPRTMLICLRSRMARNCSRYSQARAVRLVGQLCEQGVQFGLMLGGELLPIFEQRPAQPLEGGIGFLLDAPRLAWDTSAIAPAPASPLAHNDLADGPPKWEC